MGRTVNPASGLHLGVQCDDVFIDVSLKSGKVDNPGTEAVRIDCFKAAPLFFSLQCSEEIFMLKRFLTVMTVLMCAMTLGASPAFSAASKEEQRAEVRTNAQKILTQLYKARPSTKKELASAAGYAVFSNFGMKLFLAGAGAGSGIAVNNANKAETFMKMVEVQAGLGFGIKKFRVIFVFETPAAFDTFVNSGWEFGGQATAAATDGKSGGSYQGAVSVMPGVWMYQLTDKGLALEITGKGTKYYKNDDLN